MLNYNANPWLKLSDGGADCTIQIVGCRMSVCARNRFVFQHVVQRMSVAGEWGIKAYCACASQRAENA